MRLSVVIPALDEAQELARALSSLKDSRGVHEVVVADGGSSDATVRIATEHGARVVTGASGRANQMNLGARATSGDVLLFLHADCALEPAADAAVADALRRPDVVGGSFRLRIREAGPSLELIAWTSNQRARFLGIPYGDQGLFVRRRVFEKLGGFGDLPFMEDVDLARRLKREGRLVQLGVGISTGVRHWLPLGAVGTTALNWSMVTLFRFGVSPNRLAPFYTRMRKRAPSGLDGAHKPA